MKHLKLTFLLLAGSLAATAQVNKPVSATQAPAPTQTVAPTPSAYSATFPLNYVRTWQPQLPYTLETDVTSASRTVEQVRKATQYVDGLGRPLQTVSWQTSPNKTDLIAPVIYDAFGREVYKYLPYTDGNDGAIKTDPFNAQANFYNNSYKIEEPAFSGEQVFYGKMDYEASPLSRPLKTMSPGNSWAGSDKGISMQYLLNSTADAVRVWDISFDAIGDNNNIPETSVTYSAGELDKTVTLDEVGKALVEYKDKDGLLILKKVQIADAVATDYTGHDGFLCTYYVYDDFNRLRFVIPPKAVAYLQSNNWQLAGATTVINELCFRYEYDERQRMIAKKVPGAGWAYMVYDKRDRLVFTQDANMRSGGKNWWLATLYDNLNRPVQTAMMTGTGYDRVGLQTYVNGLSDNTTASNTTLEITNGIPKDLVVNQYQNGVSLYEGSNSVTLTDGFTTPDGAEITATINSGSNTATSVQQFVNINPVPSDGTLTALTYTHYDDYSWTSKLYTTANNSKLSAGNSTYSEPLPLTMNTAVKGMVTGTRVRVLEDANDLTQGKWLEAASFYDSKGRVVQVQSTNYKGGLDVVTSLYDFTGKVLSTYQVHNNAGAGINNQSVLTVMEYDHAGRVTKVSKTINDDAARTRVIAQNTYDALGQLKTKQLGQKTDDAGTPLSSQYLETQDYAYNIRGWLKGINWDGYGGGGGKTVAKNNRWFAFDLSYDWGYEHNQSNGNIAGMRWQTNGDQQERSYGYGYDNANRLMYGDFNEYRSSSWNRSTLNFNVKIGDGLDYTSAYDENGNIKRMQQWGLKGTGSIQIDNLGYDYTYNGSDLSNKLRSVSEDVTIGNTDNKLGDFTDKNRPGSGDDYDYDANGNLTIDKNKNIQSIIYNHLNLPYQITVKNDEGTPKGTITYIYDATGNKIEKRTDENCPSGGGKQTISTYLGSFVYENSVLQFFGHEEGRVRPIFPSGAGEVVWVYDYFLKDHLGNVRMMLTDEHKQDNYPALTFENANRPTETALYENADAQLTARPGAFGDASANGDQVQLLRKNVQSIGAGKLLKVMATDKVNVQVEYYTPSGTVDNTSANGLNTVVNSLVGLINGGAVGGAMHDAGNVVSSQLSSASQFTDFLAPQNASVPGSMPKAYLNILFFDEQFNFVQQNSEIVPVSVWDAKTPIVRSGKEATKNGYVYIYISNESNNLVYFDNLQVIHNRGALLEETHYYPFGLTIAGISTKAVGKLSNKYKFNDASEFNNDLNLSLYETDFRSYDNQIGRFLQPDPLTESSRFISPYVFANNNPILINDPTGLYGDTINATKNLEEVVVRTTIPRKLPKLKKPQGPSLPIPEITNIALEKSLSSGEKIMQIDRLIKNWHSDPVGRRALDGHILKNFLSTRLLYVMDRAFTMIDFYKLASSTGKGSEAPLEIPFIGGVTQMITDDEVAASDELMLDVAKKQGYVPFARMMNSSVGRRSGLTGVYTSKEVMEQILTSGGLDLNTHKVFGPNQNGYEDNPGKFDYFVVFPKKPSGVITNFFVLPINKK